MADAVALAAAVDRRQRLARGFGGIPGFHAVHAVVAMPAGLRHLLVEIGQQRLAPATGFLTERQHGFQLVPLDALVPLVALGTLHHLPQQQDVLQTVGHPGVGRQAIAAGAAGFLVIGLEALGQVEVGDETHVGLVDAHAEGNGRHHDQAFLVEEALLVVGTQFVGQSGVIRQRGEALVAEEFRDLLDLLPRQAVDDAGIAAPLGEEAEQLLARLLLGHDAVEDVRPVEAGEELLGVLQVQALDHLLAGTHVRGGGQGDPRHLREQLGKLAELQVFGTEVMAPLRHAVRFVDGEQADRQSLKEGQHARLDQPLRCQVEQLDLATLQALGDVPLLLGVEGGVQRHRRHAEFVQGGDLVLHQRDQRRHHHRQAFAQQRRDLETQGLATAGGHQYQRIATLGYPLDDPCLVATEGVVTENVFEDA
ncbi:hypothetical protein PAERUG_E5_London_17_VIM_2_12_12_01577 [Pseudomonas aeruginosa]|nr:hypothetical protein PAERUG_E5_London_17_VIM_2_12_12_01577 [Pseudomonas aeruginosa]